MTMEDELRKMTATEAVANSVSTFKTPLKSFDGRPVRYDVKNDGYDNRKQLHIYWTDLANIQSETAFTQPEFDWALNMPAKVMKNSPFGAFVISGAVLRPDLDNIPAIVASGLRFHVERIVIPGQGTTRDGTPMNDSSGYELKSIVDDGGGSVTKAAPAEANPDAVAAVLKFANGLTEEQFNQSVLRDVPSAAQDGVTRGKILARTFLKEAVEAGQLVMGADGTYVAAGSAETVTA